MTAFLSARGRFFASLSASSHSLITCAQEKKGKTSVILVSLPYLSVPLHFSETLYHFLRHGSNGKKSDILHGYELVCVCVWGGGLKKFLQTENRLDFSMKKKPVVTSSFLAQLDLYHRLYILLSVPSCLLQLGHFFNSAQAFTITSHLSVTVKSTV